MIEHKCGSKWRGGKANDCDRCRPRPGKSPTYLKEGYKQSTHHLIKDSRGSREIQHWSGRQDAVVKPKVFGAKTRLQGD